MRATQTVTGDPRSGDERLERVYEQLDGIDPDDLRDALLQITEGAPNHLRTADLDTDPGPALAVGEGGVVAVDDLPLVERIIPANNNLLPVHFLEEGAVVQKAVARVALKQAHAGLPAGSGWGTGWLVSPSLLLTNNHVIPDAAFARTVNAQFNYQDDSSGNPATPDAFDLDPDSVFRTSAGLDYTLVRVKGKRFLRPWFTDLPVVAGVRPEGGGNGEHGANGDGAAPGEAPRPFDWPVPPFPTIVRVPGNTFGWMRLPASGPAFAAGQFVNVIGHPQGRRKEVALQENTVTTVFADVVRYTTDTEPGSSGSPVLSNGWDPVALHHAAGSQDPATGQWRDNEGIRIDRIVADLRANVAAAVRTELGI